MGDVMQFPETWEEFEASYGFTDSEEIYTNGARLIPSFRVEQWLEHTDPVKHGKWIPCRERLPESYERVLLTCLVEGKRYTDLATFSMNGKVWHTFLKFWDADDIEPIAWMPLPEPYKEMDEDPSHPFADSVMMGDSEDD